MKYVQGKQIKAVDMKNKTIVALYDIDGEVYCSEANSTAYQFPITNAKILKSRSIWAPTWFCCGGGGACISMLRIEQDLRECAAPVRS